MYDVSLINLAADARSAADSFGAIECPGLTEPALHRLLESFCEIDAVENAVAAPEMQVKAGTERYVICTGQKKLMLYDASHRERPALVLSVAETVAELNGSALAARHAASHQRQLASPGDSFAPPPPAAPVVAASKPRLVALGAAAGVCLAAIIYLQMPTAVPGLFHAIKPAEAAGLEPALVGVYLTGNQPGQHGIVFIRAGELKFFELTARSAPRVVRAAGELGRVGTQLVLATDQPGGLVEVTGPDTLTYCDEVYRRIP